MAVPDIVTHYHTPAVFRSILRGILMEHGNMKFLGLFLSIFLLVSTGKVTLVDAETENVGQITFECQDDWSVYKGNCYRAFNIQLNYLDASLTCLGQGAHVYYSENEIEYFDFVAKLLPETIWFDYTKMQGEWKLKGEMVPPEFIPGWGNYQPDLDKQYTAVNPKEMLMLTDENKLFPFVCKRRACEQGYVPCDLASKCIPKSQVCNGLPECADGTDENNCTAYGTFYERLTTDNGFFTTQTFSDFEVKTWFLEAPVIKRIKLTVPTMSLETNIMFCEVMSGAPTLESSQRLALFTGYTPSVTIYSKYNFLMVRMFAKDLRSAVSSYTFRWTTNIPEIPDSRVHDVVAKDISSFFSIPFTSEPYAPLDLQLWWHIVAPEGNYISYYLEATPKDGYKREDMRYKVTAEGRTLENGYYYVSGTDDVYVQSEYVPSNGDVKIVYKLGCEMVIDTSYGYILSPEPIPNNFDCMWTLTAGEEVSRGMSLRFLEINLMEDPRVDPATESIDKLMVYPNQSETSLTDLSEVGHSPNGRFRVHFMSDAAFMSADFTIRFGTDCEPLAVSRETIKSTDMTYMFEDVTLSCPTGYKFHLEKYRDYDSVTLRCHADGWKIDGENPGAIPECRIVWCGPPTKIENGGVTRATGLQYDDKATYYCLGGFNMTGGENATCNADGDWVDVPSCTSTGCPALSQSYLTNGGFTIYRGNEFSSNTAEYNTVVEFFCNEGYDILGAVKSHCDTGEWTHENNPPSCQKIACAVPEVPNSDVPLAGPSVKVAYDETYTINCNSNYQLSEGQTQIQITCLSNRTFDVTPVCEDINECTNGASLCDDGSTTCMNIDGGYICNCISGFKHVNDYTCTDILECSDENGGCSTDCVEESGSYHCECDEGFELFESDGFNGFRLPQGETGLRHGDRYFIDHTCVPVQCPDLQPVPNGKYLTSSLTDFHYMNKVTLQCHDGYKVNKTGELATSFESTCGSDGNWNELVGCEARQCTRPSTPTYGSYDKTEVFFGQTLTLTCNLTAERKKFLTAVCLYDNDNVRFAGDDITQCPEIDCGDPELVMPVGGNFFGGIKPGTTTYFGASSSFSFTCDDGFDVKGESGDADNTVLVRCKENGRWDLGTLACTGKMCDDPGTPVDAVQVVNGYEIDSVLNYTCVREGFRISGPASYTCEYNSFDGTSAWSDNLAQNIPECTDAENPTISGNCDKTYYIDAVDEVNYGTVGATDNFAIKSLTQSPLLYNRDRLTAGLSLTFTYTDFENNEDTCMITFEIIDRNSRPTLTCPDSETISVSSRETDDYDTSSEITVSGGELSINPSSIPVSVSKIGTAEIVMAKATDSYGNEASCTFMVNFEASACFEEDIFADRNADRDCVEEGSTLVCTSTCRGSYLYYDKTNKKNFTCSGQGNWDYTSTSPHERFCLEKINPEFEVDLDVAHRFELPLTGGCVTVYRNLLDQSTGTFASRIRTKCGQDWKVSVVSVRAGGLFELEATVKLTLETLSATSAEREECINETAADPTVFSTSSLNCPSAGGIGTLTANSVTSGTGSQRCPNVGFYLDGDMCLSYGPGQYYDDDTNSVANCPTGEYQDELAVTSCKTCPDGSYPKSDQTECLLTCSNGFISESGFYPCTPCPVDEYWMTKDSCNPCPNSETTVGAEGATDVSKCYEPCAAGTYSTTGYADSGCKPCPVNFYQDEEGKMTCKECAANQITSGLGSKTINNCSNIEDACDSAYCNDAGTCQFSYHDRRCICNSGYYGERCEQMYHICDGNPCTSGAACVKGEGPEDFTCTCRIDLDICEMVVASETKIGGQDPAPYDVQSVINLAACERLCLADATCKEASYLSGTSRFCVLYNTTLSDSQLNDQPREDDKHLKKVCHIAFEGDRCERDTYNNCLNAGCSENSKCMDKVNGFECKCPSAGGYTGALCEDARDPCSPNPCVRGTCKAFGSVRYECTCPEGYKGLTCEQDIDECALHPLACAYDGKCNNLVNRYSCSCKRNFFGRNCESTPDFCRNHNCGGDNVCYNSLNRMEGVCVCDTNLFEPQYRCAMTSTTNETSVDQTSTISSDFVQSFEECETLCQENPNCYVANFIVNPNNFFCILFNDSYTGSATEDSSTAIYKDCTDRPDEAFRCNKVKEPCDYVDCNNGTCQNAGNGLYSSCNCDPGFTGSYCQHSVDDCIGNTCENNARCIDEHQGYRCQCVPGFEGEMCNIDTDDCPGSCNTTFATCVDQVDGYQCRCNPGYVGNDCDIEINECASYPCQHGGTCDDVVNGFECRCTPGWTGDMCEQRIDYCGERNCGNDGECISLAESSFCRCEGGATGKNCEKATLLCNTLSNIDVCTNGGVCVSKGGTAECSCPIVHNVTRCYMEEGLTGKNGGNGGNSIPFMQGTSLTEDVCKIDCLMNKLCVSVTFSVYGNSRFCIFYAVGEEELTDQAEGEVSTHFRRNCPIDYTGVSCELVKNSCATSPCKHNGKCIPEGPKGYHCECEPGYSGAACEIVADPCDSNPCVSQAVCRSTPTDYICQCEGGKVWTGSSCRTTRTDYTLLVNAAMSQAIPHFRTTFHIKSDELSVMMRVRVHTVNKDKPDTFLFNLYATSDLHWTISSYNEFALSVSHDGIYVQKGIFNTEAGISFTDNTFGDALFDGDWHYLGISIDKDGMLSATIDAHHLEDPVFIGANKFSLDHNVQALFGYGYIAEFQHVEIYDMFLDQKTFSNALIGLRPLERPIQSFTNIIYPHSSKMNTYELSTNLAENPNLDVPVLNCSAAEDIYHVASERLTSISSIPQLLDIYEKITASSGESLEYRDSSEDTYMWGYYLVAITGHDKSTMNYGECRLNLYIRYNEACPAVISDDTVQTDGCPINRETNSVCEISCTDQTKVLAAPTPNYIVCGSLGVKDFRQPFEDVILPSCMSTQPVMYQLVVSMQFSMDIVCSKVPSTTLSLLEGKIRENFISDINPSWNDLCDGILCENLHDVTYQCVDETSDTVSIHFLMDFTRNKLTAKTGGDEIDIMDAMLIIIQIEGQIDVKSVAGAILIASSVKIDEQVICPSGYRLDKTADIPVCVPCSEGMYLKDGMCVPCDFGSYQDETAQEECKKCEDGKTTYQKHSKTSDDCKETCQSGSYYDEDENKCKLCERHFYQSSEGKNYCIPCGKQFKTVGNGSKSVSNCREDCPPGEQRSFVSGLCVMCPRGSWRSLEYDDCQSCPANTTTYKNMRAETEGDCEIDICPLGEYFDVDETECTPCAEGFYQNELYELECIRCPGNKTTPAIGTANPEDCEFYCALGYERKGTEEVCQMCERGFYKDNVGDSKFELCVQCPTGTTDMKGATSKDNCSLPICQKGQIIDDNNECEDCPSDYFSDVEVPFTSTECLPCGSVAECTSCGELYGTAGPGSTSDQCMRYCPPGEFLNGNDCDLCPRGYYKDNSGNSRFNNCTKCPDRNGEEMTTDSEGTENVADCNVYKCAAGFFHTSTGCRPCELNTYQPNAHPFSTDTCLPCQPRFGLSTNTRSEGTDDPEKCLVICEAGKYLENTGCVFCPRGTFKENVGDSRFGNCTECSGDQTTEDVGADSSAKCDIPKCAAGNYLVNKECTACPVDQYSDVVNPNSAVECIPCSSVNGVVYGTETSGADSESQCSPTCSGGKQFDSDSGQCKECPIGFFKGDNERFGDCLPCETGRPGYVTNQVGAKSIEQCDLRDCPAGEKIENTDCVKCPVGTYQNESRKSVCYDCGENLSTDGEGKTSMDDCLVFCGEGLQGTVSCTRCPAGQFKAEPGYASCQDCPEDYTSNADRTACDTVFCSVGKEYTESDTCNPCQVGFFKDEVGNDQGCSLCPLGTTTDGSGQASCELLHCVPGKYELNSNCELCPAGTYKSISGNQECTDCPDKFTTGDVTGATAASQCDTVVCDPGSYRKPNQKTVCTPCEIGTYQPASGATSCIVCPESEITLEDGQSSEGACVPECQKGQQYNSTTEQCLLCPTGTYKDSVGNVEVCQPCDEDTTTAGQGSTDRSDCSQNVCPPGKFYQIQDDKVICLPCPLGKYSDKTMLRECIACPNGGTTQTDNTDSVEDCVEDCGSGSGYYTSTGNCDVCPKGQFNNKQGRNPNTCKLCPSGKTNTQAGSTSCSYPAPPIVEQRINLKLWVSFHVAIDECSDTSGINLVLDTILGFMKTLFQQETDQRYNGLRRFCHGQDCSNLDLCSSQPVCQLIQTRKRAITHELMVEACFNDISDFITDTEDDDANVDTVEIVSFILKLFGNRLSNPTLEILFTGFENITRTDICSVGQELITDKCEPCQAGYFGSTVGVCTQCEIDTYQDSAGEKECKPCPSNTYTENKLGSTSIDDCIEICQAGSEFNSVTKTCSECEIGYYKAAAGNDDPCTRCPPDRTTRDKGSTSADDCSQPLCLAGQYFYTDRVTGDLKCNPCDIGTFNPSVMVDECQTCPDGKSTLLPGAKLSTQCISCSPGTGFNSSRNTCFNCPKNMYNNGVEPNPNSCKFCPLGTTTEEPGQTSCDASSTKERKLVTISLTVIFKISPSSCTESELERIRTVASATIRVRFNDARKNRYSLEFSFCTSDCTNINVKFRNGKASDACPRRRKRDLTQELPLVVEFQNVTEGTVESVTNVELPTEEVIKQILAYNEDQFTPEPGVVEYESSGTPVVQLLCSAGEQPLDGECVQCSTGRYSSNGETCVLCPQDTYQDEAGQASCKDCPARTFFDGSGATASSACKSWCENNPTYCNNRGVCSDTGRRSGTCSCTENYQGTRCDIKKEPSSDLPAILGGAIGGGAALLFIILIAVGLMYRCSRGSPEKKKEPYRDPEFVQNGAYEGTYDNFGYHDGQVRPIAPYPSVGYPAIGYKPDTSFEEGSYARAYRYAPSIDGNEKGQAEDTHFVWTA